MNANGSILPTKEPANSPSSVLYLKYIVGLLPEGENPDDPYYAGDVYEKHREDRRTGPAIRWKEETKDLPYLNLIRSSSRAFPDLAHMASWMEVGTAVSRYKHLSRYPDERRNRIHRVRVSQVDFKHGASPVSFEYKTKESLETALSKQTETEVNVDARVFVVEDLSQDVIEALGFHLEIDPHFFRSHINDYMWHTNTGDAVGLKHLDMLSRKQSHFSISYLRPRYYRDTASFERATKQAAQFNVLRQLDSDRSRESLHDMLGAAATLMRAKASVWIRPKLQGRDCVVGKSVLLVDPTIMESPNEQSGSVGYPLWGGYSAFENWTAQKANDDEFSRPSSSIYESVVHCMLKLSDHELGLTKAEPKTCTLPLLMLIISDWHHVVQYITAQLGRIEWEIELPMLRKDPDIDGTMQKLHPWRRNAALYRAMIANAIDRIFSKQVQRTAEDLEPEDGLPALLRDFQLVLRDIDTIQTRINNIVSVATALQSIEESRRAMQQNRNVTRLTYLATIFIPPTFVCGILSMVPDVTSLRTTFWIFFTIAIPVTIVAFVVADFWHLQTKLKELWPGSKKKIG